MAGQGLGTEINILHLAFWHNPACFALTTFAFSSSHALKNREAVNSIRNILLCCINTFSKHKIIFLLKSLWIIFSLFQECSFNKLHDNTALRVSYHGNVRVYGHDKCNRWYFKFNGHECSGPVPIESVLYTYWDSGKISNINRHHSFDGYCENLARGTVSVELWVGKCSAFSLGNAHTGWNSVSRIMIEEVPPSQ